MASFNLSPGVIVKEEDLTNVIPAVATSIGATVIDAQWGPIDEIRIVDSVERLLTRYGGPVDRNFKDWYTARNFLAYGKDMRVIRAAHDGYSSNYDAANGVTSIANATNMGTLVVPEWEVTNTDTGSGAEDTASVTSRIFVKNQVDFEAQKENLSGTTGVADVSGSTDITFIARYAGSKGNDISVSYCSEAMWDDDDDPWIYRDLFDFKPAANSGEFGLVVLDGDVVVEKWFLSAVVGAQDEEGNSIFVGSVINDNSGYLRVFEENLLGGDQATVTAAIAAATWEIHSYIDDSEQNITLVGGADNFYETANEYQDNQMFAWDIYANSENIEINLLMAGGANATVSKYIIENVAEIRKDCVAFVSPQVEDVVNNLTPVNDIIGRRSGEDLNGVEFTSNINVNSSYAFMDGNYKYQFDPYNEVYRWVPLNGDIAGLAARTDQSNDPWWSFAGLNRGQIKNVTKFAFNPSKAERDELYKRSINPVLSFPGEGAVLYGDRTMLIRPSAFRHINVRRLFIILEKAIATAAKYTLFEFNDEFTRTRFVQQVEPFLRDIQGRRGIIANDLGADGFYVIADERVNTPEVINNNEFRARILIKPARSINFIELTFTAVNNGVDFEEIIVKPQ